MVSLRKSGSSGKKVSKLYVEPTELARKLIKELEGTKLSRGGQTWARDQYTVFLCREDFARLRSHLDELVRKLESHMERHVQSKHYATAGTITVELTMDPDLKPGYFGVLAEIVDQYGAEPRSGASPPQDKSIWDVPEGVDQADVREGEHMGTRPGLSGGAAGPGFGVPTVPPIQAPALPSVPPVSTGRPPLQQTPLQMPQQAPISPPVSRPPVPTPTISAPSAGADRMAALPSASLTPPVPTPPVSLTPAVPTPPVPTPPVPTPRAAPVATPRAQSPAAEAVEPLVLKVNGQERVFPKGKAVVGRSRDADLQIDSADVSRRHAMIYWSDGGIVVKDLGSTNGTMVNGYPVDSTVVRSSDVIRIGNAHITAVSK